MSNENVTQEKNSLRKRHRNKNETSLYDLLATFFAVVSERLQHDFALCEVVILSFIRSNGDNCPGRIEFDDIRHFESFFLTHIDKQFTSCDRAGSRHRRKDLQHAEFYSWYSLENITYTMMNTQDVQRRILGGTNPNAAFSEFDATTSKLHHLPRRLFHGQKR